MFLNRGYHGGGLPGSAAGMAGMTADRGGGHGGFGKHGGARGTASACILVARRGVVMVKNASLAERG